MWNIFALFSSQECFIEIGGMFSETSPVPIPLLIIKYYIQELLYIYIIKYEDPRKNDQPLLPTASKPKWKMWQELYIRAKVLVGQWWVDSTLACHTSPRYIVKVPPTHFSTSTKLTLSPSYTGIKSGPHVSTHDPDISLSRVLRFIFYIYIFFKLVSNMLLNQLKVLLFFSFYLLNAYVNIVMIF